MNDFRSALDAEIGELPPSTVDLRSVVAGQRRRARLQVAGGGAATVAVLAAAVGVAGAGGADRDGTGAGSAAPTCAPASPSAAPTPSPWVTGPVTPTDRAEPEPDLPVGLEGRLTAALTVAVRRELPADRLGQQRIDDVDRPALQFFGGPCDPRYGDFYLAAASVRAAGAAPAGRLTVSVQSSPVSGCRPAYGGPDPACTVERRADGTVIRSRITRGEVQGERTVRSLVAVTKPDGTTLQLSGTTAPGERTAPVLDVAALTRIGLAPDLTLYG